MSVRRIFLRAACGSVLVPGLAAAVDLDLTYHHEWDRPLAGASFAQPSPVPQQYRLPASALLLSAAKNDLDGAVQMAAGCGASLALAYALQSILTLPDSSAYAPRKTASLCSAAFLQSRYGSSYGIPAISLAASLQGRNIASIPDQLGDILLPSLLNFLIVRQFADRAETGIFGGMTLNQEGTMRFNMPTDTPIIRFDLGDTARAAESKPSSGTFLQIDQNADGKPRFMFGFRARF